MDFVNLRLESRSCSYIYPDVLAIESLDFSVATFYDIKLNHNTEALYSNLIVKPGDYIHIGHREKFNTVAIAVDINTSADYQDVAWYLRRDFFEVEYWNGNEWEKAREVTVLPTSVINLKDTSTTIYTDDDNIKYKIMFDTDGWNTGSYDNANYSVNGAPSDIDENDVYLVRIKLSVSMPVYLDYVSLCRDTELNLAIMWDDIRNWTSSPLLCNNDLYIVDTGAENQDHTLNAYGLQLSVSPASKDVLVQVRPIEKFVGQSGEKLYAIIDINNIASADFDAINYNPDSQNKISHVPVNVNYNYLANKILDDTGNRTNVIIPAQISGTLSINDGVKVLIENGDETNMTILYKIQ